MTADRTSNSHELRHLQSLMNHSHGDLGSKYIVQLLDDFVHQGPNGSHQCLVFELLGPSIDAVLEEYQEDERWTDNEDDDEEKVKLEPDVILKWSEQILQATKFLHDAGYVHGGTVGS